MFQIPREALLKRSYSISSSPDADFSLQITIKRISGGKISINLLGGLALLTASVMAGVLWDSTGPKGTFLAGASLTAVALAGLVLIRNRIEPKRSNELAPL